MTPACPRALGALDSLFGDGVQLLRKSLPALSDARRWSCCSTAAGLFALVFPGL